MKPAEYTQYDGVGLAELIRKKEISRREAIDTALALAAKHNPNINAICYLAEKQARDNADAADKNKSDTDMIFDGVPFLLKD